MLDLSNKQVLDLASSRTSTPFSHYSDLLSLNQDHPQQLLDEAIYIDQSNSRIHTDRNSLDEGRIVSQISHAECFINFAEIQKFLESEQEACREKHARVSDFADDELEGRGYGS